MLSDRKQETFYTLDYGMKCHILTHTFTKYKRQIHQLAFVVTIQRVYDITYFHAHCLPTRDATYYTTFHEHWIATYPDTLCRNN